jgi:hypothetical protein
VTGLWSISTRFGVAGIIPAWYESVIYLSTIGKLYHYCWQGKWYLYMV